MKPRGRGILGFPYCFPIGSGRLDRSGMGATAHRTDGRLDRLFPLLSYWMVMDFEDESTWLLHRVLRLRTILRYVKDPHAESGL